MRKKPSKSTGPTPSPVQQKKGDSISAGEQAPPAAQTASASQWLGRDAPWEEYVGLRVPVMSEGEIVNIVEVGGGKLRVTQPSATDLTEDGPLSFDYGGRDNAAVIFSTSSQTDVLLDEDTKIKAMEQSYKFDREDPIYHSIIQAYTNFIIGKGVKITAADANPTVQEYLDKFLTENRMDGRDAAWVRQFMRTGELAIRWFTQDAMGRPAAVPKIRSVPFWRITKIVKSAEDSEETSGYEILKDVPSGASFGVKIGETTQVSAKDMTLYHALDAENTRGEPPFLSVMRACKWYSDWLLNRVVLNRYRTAHVLFKKVIGSPNKVSSVSTSAPDASSHSGSGGKLEKRLPKPGTMVVHSDSIEYEWKSPNLGAGDAREDGRAILLFIAAGAQVPEFMLGDSSQANFSSTIVSQNPFVRQVEFWQDFFAGIFRDIGRRVIEHGISTGAIPKQSWENAEGARGSTGRLVRGALLKLGVQEGLIGVAMKKRTVPTSTEVAISYPPLITADSTKDAQTLQLHQAMNAVSIRTIRDKLGYDDEMERKRLADEAEANAKGDGYDAARDAEIGKKGDEDEDSGNGGDGGGDDVKPPTGSQPSEGARTLAPDGQAFLVEWNSGQCAAYFRVLEHATKFSERSEIMGESITLVECDDKKKISGDLGGKVFVHLTGGGPGSGNFGHGGRPGERGGSSASDQAQTAFSATVRDGGVSVDFVGRKPDAGFMVSPFKDREMVVPFTSDKSRMAKEFRKFQESNGDLLTERNHFLGAWRSKGKVFLDVSLNVRDRGAAESLAKKHEQLAIWDVKAGKELAMAEAAADAQRSSGGTRMILIPLNFTDKELKAALDLLLKSDGDGEDV